MISRALVACVAGCALGVGLIGSCSNLEPIEEQQCGNALIEQRADGQAEDCDSHPLLGMKCGDPGTLRECRFECAIAPDEGGGGEGAAAAESGCAAGYGCGADGICRAATGRFVASTTLGGGATFLIAGDFDGDGAPDVFASSDTATFVHYLDAGLNEQLELRQPLTLSTARFARGSLTTDKLDDVAYTEGDGLGVLRGAADQSLASTAYTSLPIPLASDAVIFGIDALERTIDPETKAVSELPGLEPMAIAHIPNGADGYVTISLLARLDQTLPADVVLVGNGTYGDGVQPVPPVKTDTASLIDRVPVGQLAPGTPCDEYVLAFRQQNVVLVGTPCISNEQANGQLVSVDVTILPPLREIPLDLGSFDVDEAHLFDLDQDGDLDVILSPLVAADGSRQPARAALGPFAFAPENEFPPEHPTEELELLTLEPGERLLALADINGDMQPDFVTSRGIFLSEPSGPPCAMGNEREGASGGFQHCPAVEPKAASDIPYAFAVLGDFNGNGSIDFALSTGVTRALTIFNALAGGYAEFTVLTEGYPVELATGDFDGDSLADVAFADRPCATTDQTCEAAAAAGGDPLAVSFGRPMGGLEQPRIMGRLARIEHVVSASFRETGEAFLDGTDEVGVLSSTEVNGFRRLGFSILHGRSDRQLQSPYLVFLRDDEEPSSSLLFEPRSHVVGQFVEKTDDGYGPGNEHADLAVIGEAVNASGAPVALALWVLASTGEAELAESTSWYAPLELPAGWNPERGSFLAIDLNGDGVDELVYVNGHELGFGGGLIVAKIEAPDGTPTIQLSDVIEEEMTSLTGPPRTIGGPGSIARDVDGDGRMDVVTVGFTGDIETIDRRDVIVYWNDLEQTGGDPFDALSASNVSRVSFSVPSIFGVTAINALNLDTDGQLELVLSGEDGAWSIDIAPGDPRKLLEVVPLSDIAPGGLALETDDLDGDGVDDLVVGYQSHVQLYLGVAVNP